MVYDYMKYLLLAVLLLACLYAQAQKKSFEERIVFSLGLGASEVNQTFGDAAYSWRTRFSYKGGLGYRFSKRLDAGLNVWVTELQPSNALYAPGTNGIVLIRQETKGERFTLIGVYAKVIPIASLNRLSLQVDFGISGHTIVDNFAYSQSGTGYTLTAAYHVIRDDCLRLEPYFSFGESTFPDKVVNGDQLFGRGYKSFSIGLQIAFGH